MGERRLFRHLPAERRKYYVDVNKLIYVHKVETGEVDVYAALRGKQFLVNCTCNQPTTPSSREFEFACGEMRGLYGVRFLCRCDEVEDSLWMLPKVFAVWCGVIDSQSGNYFVHTPSTFRNKSTRAIIFASRPTSFPTVCLQLSRRQLEYIYLAEAIFAKNPREAAKKADADDVPRCVLLRRASAEEREAIFWRALVYI